MSQNVYSVLAFTDQPCSKPGDQIYKRLHIYFAVRVLAKAILTNSAEI